MTRIHRHRRATLSRASGLGALAVALATFSVAPAQASEEELRAEVHMLMERLRKLEGKLAKSEKTAAADKKKDKEEKQKEKEKKEEAEKKGPDNFRFRGLTITPGGFFALESVWRSRWVGADINTPFQNIPYNFFATAHSSEFRFSARPSRFSLLVKGDVDPFTKLFAYVETDLLGAAQTANSNESNSYNLRLRQAYANIDWEPFGAHFMFGQAWSLVTLNKVGIKPDTSVQPLTIDHQYVPGYTWARQPGLRLTMDFNKEFWFSFAAEGAATTFGGYGLLPPGFVGITSLPLQNPILFGAGASGGLFNIVNSYSLNRAPDLIGKGAWDLTLADSKIHVEGFGLMRNFTTRAYWGNRSAWGGGAGGGIYAQVIPDLLDVQISGAIGHGIGRYGSGQLPDATWSAYDGGPLPINERMILVGGVLHPRPDLDTYAYAGGEFAARNPQYVAIPGNVIFGGYANPFFNNLGCNIENDALTTTAFLSGGTAANAPLGGPFACAGLVKDIRQVTGGFWHTLYDGRFGKVRGGVQYSYTIKDGFIGVGGAPRARDSMVFTSFRYYPFEGGSAPPTVPVLARY
jgi:hypothetical protein